MTVVSSTDLEANKALVRRHFQQLINEKNFAVLSDIAADFVDHDAPPGMTPNVQGIKEFFGRVHAACPDLHVVIDDLVAEGDLVVARNRWCGTHSGTMFGFAATGKTFELKGVVIWRVADGKLCERWAVMDLFGFTRQLAG
jgi:steroid delta-isomerase-like uncharacterized protein